jgi:hypothetical protein
MACFTQYPIVTASVFICVWLAQHPNVPGPEYRSTRRRLTRKLKWMVVTLFFPKFMLGPAFIEHMEARACCELAADQGRRWPRTYAYFANMGGFLLSFLQSPACERGQSAPHAEIEQSGLSRPGCDAEGAYTGRILILNGRQILELTKCPNVQFSRPIGRSVDGASLSGLDSDISS